MAQLPSFEQLGLVTPQPAQGPLLSPQVVQEAAEAGAQLGQSAVGLGSAINRADYYQGMMDRAQAQQNVKQGLSALQQEITSDPSQYATAGDRFQKGYDDLIARERQNVTDPAQLAKFNAQATGDFTLYQKQIGTWAHKTSLDAQNSNFETRVQIGLNDIAQNPAMAPSILRGLQEMNNLRAATGAKDQATVTLVNQNLVKAFAATQVNYDIIRDPVGAQQKLLGMVNGTGLPPASTSSNNLVGADAIIPFVMNRHEGAQYVANDNGQGPSRYGIVGADNGLTPQQVQSLAPDKAVQIYKTNYWDKIGADNLPANMQLPAFDTAVQFGVGPAQQMIDAANGDPQKLLDLRAAKYQQLVISNPAKYAGSAEGWANRQQLLSQEINGQSKVQNLSDPYQLLDPAKVPEYLRMADAEAARQTRATELQQKQAIQQTQNTLLGKLQTPNGLAISDVMNSNLPPVGEGSKEWFINQIKAPVKVNENDPDVIRTNGMIDNLRYDHPDQFMNFDFTSLAGKLPYNKIAELQATAGKMRSGDAGIEADNKQAKDIQDSVADMLPLAWRGAPGKPLDPQSSTGMDAAAFKGNLVSAVKDAQATGGKPLSRDDVRKMASDMLAPVSLQGGGALWGDGTIPHAYQVPRGTNPALVYRGTPDQVYVPETFRIGFARAWQNKYGNTPSENDMRLAYAKSLQAPTQ